jgi:hypothetical protein
MPTEHSPNAENQGRDLAQLVTKLAKIGPPAGLEKCSEARP